MAAFEPLKVTAVVPFMVALWVVTAAVAGSNATGIASVVVGGSGNQASNTASSVLGGYNNIANGAFSTAIGRYANSRGLTGFLTVAACNRPIAANNGISQMSFVILGTQTTDATATVLASDSSVAGLSNQVILPNNAAYHFKGSVIANVTGAANGAAWEFSGAIMRGANAASTVLINTPSINRIAASSGATAWTIALTADTTNGGLAVTVTGAAATTIRWVAKLETVETTF